MLDMRLKLFCKWLTQRNSGKLKKLNIFIGCLVNSFVFHLYFLPQDLCGNKKIPHLRDNPANQPLAIEPEESSYQIVIKMLQ